MKQYSLIFTIFMICLNGNAQQPDTLILHQAISKYDTITYKRITRYEAINALYHVEDYFENGQIQMKGSYSSFDKNVKENYWCNYRTNTKQGFYQTWYQNGNPQCQYNFVDGKKNGICTEYYPNGQIAERGSWIPGSITGNTHGMRHGTFKGWDEQGQLLYDFSYDHGLKSNPIDTNYQYLLYTPPDYNNDSTRVWPLIIYLHGGSGRGTNLKKLYNAGIPDQIYRGREFKFIIASPQCPALLRWSTDNWFENFFHELKSKYRIDTNRVYLTGESLGGAGTWCLAEKYPDIFAAIAPICGFTSHIDAIYKNIEKLNEIPIWAFHGAIDKSVPVEETDRIIEKLNGKNPHLKYTRMPDVGHWVAWLVYPEKDLYSWFLKFANQK